MAPINGIESQPYAEALAQQSSTLPVTRNWKKLTEQQVEHNKRVFDDLVNTQSVGKAAITVGGTRLGPKASLNGDIVKIANTVSTQNTDLARYLPELVNTAVEDSGDRYLQARNFVRTTWARMNTWGKCGIGLGAGVLAFCIPPTAILTAPLAMFAGINVTEQTARYLLLQKKYDKYVKAENQHRALAVAGALPAGTPANYHETPKGFALLSEITADRGALELTMGGSGAGPRVKLGGQNNMNAKLITMANDHADGTLALAQSDTVVLRAKKQMADPRFSGHRSAVREYAAEAIAEKITGADGTLGVYNATQDRIQKNMDNMGKSKLRQTIAAFGLVNMANNSIVKPVLGSAYRFSKWVGSLIEGARNFVGIKTV